MSSKEALAALKARPLAKWYDDAKLGIYIHWGLFSVPGWAPWGDDFQTLIKKKGYRYQLAHNPYAEWYLNTMKIKGSPTRRHHVETYGEDFSYYDFVPEFTKAAANVNAKDWADLFARAGARYSVMVTKHHDGYTLWPTTHRNTRREGLHSERDFVGEVTDAVRARGMKMGLYYSGGLDWSFKETAIDGPYTFLTNTPQEKEYVDYSTDQIRELIERYEPSILWNDIRYPKNCDLVELFSHYYDAVPDGVINDRWNQTTYPENPLMRVLIDTIGWFHARLSSDQVDPPGVHHDYVTPEYVVIDNIREDKWESCRGLGTSFGYNRNEPDDNLLTTEELIHSFADIVSKNGNLLINVGPKADGTIPEAQRERLLDLGQWLSVNGEAIYETRPWKAASDGEHVRYTSKGDAVYAICFKWPEGELALDLPEPGEDFEVTMLGREGALQWKRAGGRTIIESPPIPADQAPCRHAYVFKMTGVK
jgi:alpha-L-fucosidase